jgi:RimJ/RimL family protein N-acetyltransferase
MKPEIKTKRLILKSMSLGDAESLFSYRSLEQVFRFQSWAPENIEDARYFIQHYSSEAIPALNHWKQFGIYLRNTQILIGDCGFCPLENNSTEIGYTVAPDFQSQGYATEAVKGLINYLIYKQNIQHVIARTDPENQASIQVLLKIGFQRHAFLPRNTWIRGEWHDDVVFIFTRL